MALSFAAAFQSEDHRSFTWHADHDAALLLIHGFPGTPAEMRPLAKAFHSLGWTTSAPLLPGFGPEVDTINKKSHTDWLNALQVSYAELRRHHSVVALLGLSMGGALALQLAAHHPPQALILLSPFWKLEHALWQAMPLLKYVLPSFKPFRLFKPDFNDAATRQGIINFMPDLNLDDPATQRAILDFPVPMNLIDQIRQAGQRGYQAIPRISCPTLIIQGRQDELVKPDLTRHLCQRFTTSPRYVEVDAPHALQDPSQACWPDVLRAITQFLLPLSPSGVSPHD